MTIATFGSALIDARLETDWLTAREPIALIRILGRQDVLALPTTRRKLRFFALALVRAVWGRISDGRINLACLTAELRLDGRATLTDAQGGYESAMLARPGNQSASFELAAAMLAAMACDPNLRDGYETFQAACIFGGQLGIGAADQAAMLRCLFPDPFRRVPDDAHAGLRNSLGVVALGMVRQSAQARRYGDLPHVADALEAAGLGRCELLQHLRGLQRCAECLGSTRSGATELPCPKCSGSGWLCLPAVHVGGCWALDLLLGH